MREVVQDFNPPAMIFNCSTYLHAFIKGMLRKQGMESAAPVPTRPQDNVEDDRPPPLPDGLEDFLDNWELNSDSKELLLSLSESVLREVMQGFRLEMGTKDRGGQLQKWV